ncbi:MAG: YetF domain-containing protein [Thermosynechococcaceae cyanobacterium]
MLNDVGFIIETLVIGTLAYIGSIILLRVSGKRTLSKWNSFDFVVTIALGSILASVLLSNQTSLAQGLVGFGLLVSLQAMITWTAARSTVIQKLIKAEPALLLYQGKMQHKVMKRERVAEGEILAALRTSGVASVEDTAAVVLETDGSFSVIQDLGNAPSALKDVKEFERIARAF